MLFFERIIFSTFSVFTFPENMARKKMATAAVDLTFDFHVNRSDVLVRRPFSLANRVEDPTRAPPCWARTE